MLAFKLPHLLPDPSAAIKGHSPGCSGTDWRVGRIHLGRLHLINGGLPLMGVPLGADHPPGGCPQQPRQVVRNDRPVTATLRKGATTCMARHVACAGEDSRVTVGSTPTVYHRRPEARGVAAVTPGRKAPAAAGAHAFLGPACGAARVIPAQPGWSTLDAATSTGGLLGARR